MSFTLLGTTTAREPNLFGQVRPCLDAALRPLTVAWAGCPITQDRRVQPAWKRQLSHVVSVRSLPPSALIDDQEPALLKPLDSTANGRFAHSNAVSDLRGAWPGPVVLAQHVHDDTQDQLITGTDVPTAKQGHAHAEKETRGPTVILLGYHHVPDCCKPACLDRLGLFPAGLSLCERFNTGGGFGADLAPVRYLGVSTHYAGSETRQVGGLTQPSDRPESYDSRNTGPRKRVYARYEAHPLCHTVK